MIRCKPTSRQLLAALFAAFAVALAAMPLAAQESPPYTPPENARGLNAEHPFMSSDGIEHIDLATGNLVLKIPLGQTYSVGPKLSYQLQATYNARAWDSIAFACNEFVPGNTCNAFPDTVHFALPSPSQNAGLGWEVHFGKLYAPSPAADLSALDRKRWPNRDLDENDLGTRWLYVAPDGSRHTLHQLPGREASSRFSKDGSFLRLKVDGGTAVVESPDGLLAEFEQTSERAGTQFCGNGVTGCWRFKELRDLYGNYVRVDYSTSGDTETWSLSDSTERAHQIHFKTDPASTAGGDGSAQGGFTTPEGDEWGDPRRIVDRVSVATFGGGTADYVFNYTTAKLARGCPHDSTGLPGGYNSLRTRILASITVPESQPYVFDTSYVSNPSPGNSCDLGAGTLSEVTLPTRGKLAYGYGNWYFPQRCYYREAGDETPFEYRLRGIRSRTSKRADNTTEGIWTYANQLLPAITGAQQDGANCARADYRKTTVDGPEAGGTFTRTVTYHSVSEGPRQPQSSDPISDWQVTDHGLPYTKDISIPGSGGTPLFLSRQTLECTDPGNPACSAVRSEYVRYAMEYRPCVKTAIGGAFHSLGCFQINPLQEARRTVYHDDGGRYVENRSSDYNGGGHFRLQVTEDNFEGGTRRVEVETAYTDTDPAGGPPTSLPLDTASGYFDTSIPASTYLPGPARPWLLQRYSRERHLDGGRTYVTEARFDHKGQIRCRRQRKNAEAQSKQDLVRRFVFSSEGLVTEETLSGGEFGDLPVNASSPNDPNGVCVLAGNWADGNRYVWRHEYEHLIRAKSHSTQLTPFLFDLDLDIDRNTGLPMTSRNPAGQATSFSYDALARLTHIAPEASLGEAESEIVYENTSSSPPRVIRRRRVGSSVLTSSTSTYDDLGRLRKELLNTQIEQAERRSTYDAYGRLTSRTVWQEPSAVDDANATFWNTHDVFGRPREIVQPDGWSEQVLYQGLRKQTNRVQVATSQSSETWSDRVQMRDGLGRLVRSKDPISQTRLIYDPYGRVVEAIRYQAAGSGPRQKRKFAYDARGLLLSEEHPEVGLETYSPNALGLATQIERDGQLVRKFRYDAKGRPTQLLGPGPDGQEKTWQSWVYGTSNNPPDYRQGKVALTTRTNYLLDGGGGLHDYPVEERYEYKGKLGQLSKRTTTLRQDGQPWGAFETLWSYDALGDVTQLTYPRCVSPVCQGADDLQAPTRALSRGLAGGRLRSLASGAIQGTLTYHPNGQLATLTTPTTIAHLDMGTDGSHRPARISFTRPGSQTPFFDTGDYSYDGAGNIRGIGQDTYTYDTADRLLSGTVKAAGASRQQTYTYDEFDNLTSVRTDNGGMVDYHNSNQNQLLYVSPQTTQNHFYDDSGRLTGVGDAVNPGFSWSYDPLDLLTRFRHQPQGLALPVDYLSLYGPRGNHRFFTWDSTTGSAANDFERTIHLRNLDGSILREHKVRGFYQDSTWTFEKDFVHGPLGLLATQNSSGTRRDFHQDHLRTPRAITDGAGNVLARRDYYPFGAEISAGGQEDEPTSKFTGHARNAEGISDYMFARTYAYPLFHFTAPDPARDGWNLYAYVGNNPIKYVDPDGKIGVFGVVAGAAIDLGVQTLIEGKALSDVNWVSVGISAASGAAGVGLGRHVAKIASSAGGRIALNAAGSAVIGATSSAVNTAGTNLLEGNALTEGITPQSLGQAALLSAALGATGSLIEEGTHVGVQKVGRLMDTGDLLNPELPYYARGARSERLQGSATGIANAAATAASNSGALAETGIDHVFGRE